MQNNKNAEHGATFLELLFLLFLGLKLSGSIDWPWLWVFSPVWIPLGVVVLLFIGAVIYAMVEGKNGKGKR